MSGDVTQFGVWTACSLLFSLHHDRDLVSTEGRDAAHSCDAALDLGGLACGTSGRDIFRSLKSFSRKI